MHPYRNYDVEGRVLFRRPNGQFMQHPYTPPFATQEEKAKIAARRGKPATGSIVSRPALRLPAAPPLYTVDYGLDSGNLTMWVSDPDGKAGMMTVDITGRYEDEIYELCLLFRSRAANYMTRCSDGDSAGNMVLLDLLSMERRGADFPIARGDYVLVADRNRAEDNQPSPIKITFKPSFLDRLPPIGEEWAEVIGNADENHGNPRGGAEADNNAPAGDAAAADNGQDRREGGGEIENGDENTGDF